MTHSFSRRNILILTAASLAAACVTVKDGDTTTHILNVKKVQAYATAGLNAAKTMASAFSLVPLLQPYTGLASTLIVEIEKALNAFTAAAGDTLEIRYTEGNWRTLVDTLLESLQRLLDTLLTALGKAAEASLEDSSPIVKRLTVVKDALATIVAIFEAAVSVYTIPTAGTTPMSEGEALAVLSK